MRTQPLCFVRLESLKVKMNSCLTISDEEVNRVIEYLLHNSPMSRVCHKLLKLKLYQYHLLNYLGKYFYKFFICYFILCFPFSLMLSYKLQQTIGLDCEFVIALFYWFIVGVFLFVFDR